MKGGNSSHVESPLRAAYTISVNQKAMTEKYLNELRDDVILILHGVESKHVQSAPVKETFQGKTVWEGIVEVFELVGHPKAPRVYAWAHDMGNPKQPRQHVAVFHIAPVTSAVAAVRAAIIQEFRDRESAEAE